MFKKRVMFAAVIFSLATLICQSEAWFSPWNSWSSCSVKCGVGISRRERITKNGNCYGEIRQEQSCNVGDCQVTSNIALGKPVEASSTFLAAYPPSNAVDGNKSTDFYAGGCTMTNKDKNPWLRIALNELSQVMSVNIYKRSDCCPERMNYLKITVGNFSDGTKNKLCGQIDSMGENNMTELHCVEPIVGLYVHIGIPGPQFLSICEAEVIGKVEPLASNVARNRPVTADKNYLPTPSSMAVDGDLSKHFYTECSSNHPYAQVDLGKDYLITKVYLYMGCCIERILDTVITIGGADDNTKKECGIVKQTMKKTVSGLDYFQVICKVALVGRYVKAQIRKNSTCFSTNELEVYGYEL